MKALLLLLVMVVSPLCMAAQELYNPARSYNYFIREAKASDNNDTRIVVNEKGDTTLVAHYKLQHSLNNSLQEFTKVFKGTPFFKNGWYKGKLSAKSGQDVTFLMAYNIEQNVLYIVKNAGADAVAIRPDEFTIEGHTFRKYDNVFLETLYLRKNILLKGYDCVLSSRFTDKTGYEPSGGDAGYEGEFRKSHKFFTIQDDMLQVVSTGRKALQSFPKTQRPVLEQFVKQNNLNLKTEAGLIELFRYYDTL
ncbi:hypothetical protein [Emticicia sp. 21SJ11W-3]|uniref:hypothetical protein n=1 Tax=Emticicia sp. 21SJ11W-3 TaxID=2916755 RepID=UPI0020A15DCA|nr:hypothetical protein [Emticicia sp. 21SJ11W-3]UTA69142.1 hypothetical protein MB380_04905 [Emticicia sp. 21SJ11W-3]